MKIKIGNVIHDGKKEPVMIILDEIDKENIKNYMKHGEKTYCEYPDNYSKEFIDKWSKYDE